MDAELQGLLDALPLPPELPSPWPELDQSAEQWRAEVARLRAAVEARALPGSALPEVASVADHQVNADVLVRVYRPEGDGPHPAVVMLHGGGFWVGGGPSGLAAADGGCRLLCSTLGAVIVNVDYRQAPEWRFPTAHQDAWAATAWTAELSFVDDARIAVNGASAGANLAAGVALMARTRGPRLVLQQLLVPTLDATLSSPSCARAIAGDVDSRELSGKDLVLCWDYYLGPDGDPTDPLASPLLEHDLAGLPPAHIVVGEHDPLRDDGLRYAEALRAAGVAVTCDRYPMTHFTATPDIGASYVSSVIGALKQAFAP